MGLTRLERAKALKEKAKEMERKAIRLEIQAREKSNKADTHRKVILGSLVMAAIRSGRLVQDFWTTILEPGISLRDAKRIGPWESWAIGQEEALLPPETKT